ncbi:Protein of unknown function [Prauserella marina]|uniref:Uncharacterized protein n=1 Tax=Prauserella marina TaxID=530584 RepID=A0A1G6QZV7_9PSEU|nr:DUF2867 domain-containing protein [Prauserella marina]PWV76797.1 uncharacterized protein DUF2867 [Prauserella marina]SDC97838.1 Protein of unknown function [Prauserella marina]
MRIRNIHARVVDADADDIAPLLATMGQPGDLLYPPLWEPMRLDGPVAVGASGTHGTISAYEPGRLIEFTFPDGIGVTGTHTFTVTTLDRERSLVRHEVDAEAGPTAWLAWKLLIEPSHDAVLEQVLDRLQAAVSTALAAPATTLSGYARLLRWFERPRARAVEPSRTGLISDALPEADDSDMFVIERRRETPADPDAWARAIFTDPPPWAGALMTARQHLPWIDRGEPGTFAVIERNENEVLLGADAGHLDFRTAVRCEPDRVVLSGAVRLHNRRGRAYYALVRRIHPLIVRALLTRAARRLARESARSGAARAAA